jgi:hypothetical protein
VEWILLAQDMNLYVACPSEHGNGHSDSVRRGFIFLFFFYKLTVTSQEGHYLEFCVGKAEYTRFERSGTYLIGNLEVVFVT